MLSTKRNPEFLFVRLCRARAAPPGEPGAPSRREEAGAAFSASGPASPDQLMTLVSTFVE